MLHNWRDKNVRVAERFDTQAEYGCELTEQLERLRRRSADLYESIDLKRIAENDYPSFFKEGSHVVDFEASEKGGRGESYRHAQQNPLIRAVGIKQLFNLISPGQDLRNLSSSHKILDVLGGNGTLTRAFSNLLPSSSMPSILTSDLSEDMIIAAQAYGLPALRQPAQCLLLKDNSFDGVIIAYGTHHIPQDQRLQVCREAFRVLKPGGRVAFHDFEKDSPVALWFNEVVDPYSLTGHNFLHFTSEEIGGLLLDAGFSQISIQYLYDPFVISADSSQQVEQLLGEHLLDMYGLVKVVDIYGNQQAQRLVYALALRYFQYCYQRIGLGASFGVSHIQISKRENRWYIEMPRVALVGSAIKPSCG